jgi:hypothetical protein
LSLKGPWQSQGRHQNKFNNQQKESLFAAKFSIYISINLINNLEEVNKIKNSSPPLITKIKHNKKL